MIISVASGKGGTGKTTISVNLSLSLAQENYTRLLDCDVEEPNSYLFIKSEIERIQSATVLVPQIDETKCTYCKKCAVLCHYKAISVMKNVVLTFPNLCHSCGGCKLICPEQAIMEQEREIGKIEIRRKDRLELIMGTLNIGEAMSPPLIRQVKSYAQTDRTTIIDAPPGTSCPVITSVKDSHFVILVTEPTPFGLHDLKLAVEVVECLNIPYGIVINRSDIGDDKVWKYANQKNIPILMEIPFSRSIAEAYSRGIPLIEIEASWKTRFIELYQKIEKIVKRCGQ